MDKKYVIFDMDGTLVDSMVYWRSLPREFLEHKGVAHIPAEILEQIKPLTISEAAELFIRELGLEGTADSLSGEINALMESHYRRDIPLKPGVEAYLETLSRRGVEMCVASATAEPLMRTCLERLGVLERFAFLLSCETVGVGKTRPDVYFAAARLGCRPEEAAVYEDALYAARTAKAAGFYVVGVYDSSSAAHWEELTQLADETAPPFQGQTDVTNVL